MDENMATQQLMENLQAIGFGAEQISWYLSRWKAGKTDEQLKLLATKRESLLEQVHQQERQIHCLDYLVYQIEHGKV